MHTQVPPELRAMAMASPESITDQELMLLLCTAVDPQGQNELFGEFYRRFHTRVLSWCLRLSRDRARATDLAQEVFLRAWRHIGTFRGDSKPSTWLYVITRNHCLSAVERLATDPLEGGAPLPPRLPDHSVSHPDHQIQRRQRCQELCQLMNAALEPMEARVLALHYGYEVPLGTLTRGLALGNPSGAKAYIVNGRRKLKGALSRLEAKTNGFAPGLQFEPRSRRNAA
jgi:RNA polymerase sigma factor (sigma-70 family)